MLLAIQHRFKISLHWLGIHNNDCLPVENRDQLQVKTCCNFIEKHEVWFWSYFLQNTFKGLNFNTWCASFYSHVYNEMSFMLYSHWFLALSIPECPAVWRTWRRSEPRGPRHADLWPQHLNELSPFVSLHEAFLMTVVMECYYIQIFLCFFGPVIIMVKSQDTQFTVL